MQEALEKLNAFFAEDVAELRELYRDSGLELLPEEGPVEIGSGE